MSAFKKAKIGLVQFLGSNCDWDCLDAVQRHFGIDLEVIWHKQTQLPKLDGLILPGGFSYGDALRSGALASHTSIMQSVVEFSKKGGAILGICNGFQVLTESHILPGALLHNNSGQFICEYLNLSVGDGTSGYHQKLKNQKFYNIPVAHGEGRYFAPDDVINKLNDQGQVIFRYEKNPNGSVNDIAGIISENGRVLGLMPHPERATDKLLSGSADGLPILGAFLESCV